MPYIFFKNRAQKYMKRMIYGRFNKIELLKHENSN
nr:MAG TPA: hypothetical protein [Caudoviricetes sp.]